jgi:hypothetical protein
MILTADSRAACHVPVFSRALSPALHAKINRDVEGLQLEMSTTAAVQKAISIREGILCFMIKVVVTVQGKVFQSFSLIWACKYTDAPVNEFPLKTGFIQNFQL